MSERQRVKHLRKQLVEFAKTEQARPGSVVRGNLISIEYFDLLDMVIAGLLLVDTTRVVNDDRYRHHTCVACGEGFRSKQPAQRYCSQRCLQGIKAARDKAGR